MATITGINTIWVVEVKDEDGMFFPAQRQRSKNFLAATSRSTARDYARSLRESGGVTTRVVGYTATKSNSGH